MTDTTPTAADIALPDLLITGGRVIDPASERDETADVLIERGRVSKIGPALTAPEGARVIDATGKLVCPGLIDPHVHLREPGQEHKETIESGTRAAVAGGFTTVCCMPNTAPSIDCPEIVRFIYDRAHETARCRVYPVAAATRGRQGEELTELALLAQAGAVGISDDGDVVESAGTMMAIMREMAPLGLTFMQHCQEPSLTRGASMHAGNVSTRLGLTGWPRIAEEIIIARDIALVRETGCRYHVQHLSSGRSVDLIRAARAEGLPVTAEASPHHLILTDEACDGYNTGAKMNPPLREMSDVEAIRQGVAEGVLTVLATDHAPHTSDEKAAPFEEAPFGIIGLETALALYAEALVATGLIDWPRLIALMTIEPARLCNLDRAHRDNEGLGELFEGGPADLTIIDPDFAWTITESDLAGRSENTPFLGRQVTGRPTHTIVGGTVTFEIVTAAT